MIWNEAVECAPRERIEAVQLDNLRTMLCRVYDNVSMYREKLDAIGFRPGDLNNLNDLKKLPFTVKEDLRQHYPYGLFAVPMKEVVRVHASSGTTGKPTVVGYTKGDIARWAEMISRIVVMAGGRADDIAQIAFGYGLFTGAFGLHYGLENIGATVIPVSSGNTERQLLIMRDFMSTLLISTPSYALYLGEALNNSPEGRKDIRLRVGLFGGEGMTAQMRSSIESLLGISATQNYGLSEIIGPGVSGECEHKCGMHVAEDHFILEVIDPQTLETLPYGEKGELVITAITKEALPMLRYRTRDITRLMPETCACGRTSLRMDTIQGRTDDMLIIRGVNVFPSQIEGVLLSTAGVGPHYEIVVKRERHLDVLEVRVELSDASLLESFRELESLENQVRSKLRSVLGIDAKVSLVEPATLKRFEGKAKRVIDMRGAV